MRLNNSNWYLLYELCVSSVIWSLLCVPSVLWRCWIGGRKGIWPVKTEWWGTGVVSVRSEVQMICTWSSWCHCHPIISCCSKIQNGLPFWCRLTQVVLEKRLLNGRSSSSSSTSSSSSMCQVKQQALLSLHYLCVLIGSRACMHFKQEVTESVHISVSSTCCGSWHSSCITVNRQLLFWKALLNWKLFWHQRVTSGTQFWCRIWLKTVSDSVFTLLALLINTATMWIHRRMAQVFTQQTETATVSCKYTNMSIIPVPNYTAWWQMQVCDQFA